MLQLSAQRAQARLEVVGPLPWRPSLMAAATPASASSPSAVGAVGLGSGVAGLEVPHGGVDARELGLQGRVRREELAQLGGGGEGGG